MWQQPRVIHNMQSEGDIYRLNHIGCNFLHSELLILYCFEHKIELKLNIPDTVHKNSDTDYLMCDLLSLIFTLYVILPQAHTKTLHSCFFPVTFQNSFTFHLCSTSNTCVFFYCCLSGLFFVCLFCIFYIHAFPLLCDFILTVLLRCAITVFVTNFSNKINIKWSWFKTDIKAVGKMQLFQKF